MKVAICTCGVFDFSKRPFDDYVSVTNKIKAEYCRQNPDVDFIWASEPMHKDRDPHFARFALLLYAFSKGYDWAVWMDCDAVPVNFEKDISKWLKGKEQDRVIIEDDILGLNSGVMAVPNTEHCIDWLLYLDSQEIYDSYVNSPFQDQDAIRDSLEDAEYSYLRTRPDKDFGFNNYENIYQWYITSGKECPNQYRHGDFCLHIPGYADGYRRIRFQQILEDLTKPLCPVCGTVSAPYFEVPLNKTYNGMADKQYMIGDAKENSVYCRCPHCGMIFSPELAVWGHDKKRRYIYNDTYDFIDRNHRDREKEKQLVESMRQTMLARKDRVIDIGGWYGGICEALETRGAKGEKQLWADKMDLFFGEKEDELHKDAKYSLAISFEAIERTSDAGDIFCMASRALLRHGQLLLKTPIYDKLDKYQNMTPDKWDIAAPRCGVTNIMSEKSLEILASRYGFKYLKEVSNGNLAIFEKVAL